MPKNKQGRTITPPQGYQTVAEVVRDELCHSCGVCGGICPAAAIDFDSRACPQVNTERCNDCGLCLQVCSGWQGTVMPNNVRSSASSFIAYSMDEKLRRQSSSGGLVTELLCYLLKTGRIKKALVTIADPQNPSRPISVLAQSELDLLQSNQSRYCFFPWGKTLAKLLRNAEPYAVVGTSCQLSSFQKTLDLFPKLRDNLKLQIGICCESNIEPQATDHLLKVRQVERSELEHIEYRNGRWPGIMVAFLKSGREVILSNRNRLEGAINYLKFTYGRERCDLCSDVLCRVADITVGDPWARDIDGKLQYRNSDGYSAVMVRSPAALDILMLMRKERRIWLEEEEVPGSIFNVQILQERAGKKRVLRTLVSAQKKGRPSVSDSGLELENSTEFFWGVEFRRYISRLARREPFRSFFMKLFFSPLGDFLTWLNALRKQNRNRKRA